MQAQIIEHRREAMEDDLAETLDDLVDCGMFKSAKNILDMVEHTFSRHEEYSLKIKEIQEKST
jgi:hypothetical protein